MFQAGSWLVVCVRAVAENAAGVPDRPGIDDHESRFLAHSHAVQEIGADNRFGPRLAVPEPRLVVIRKYAEYGRAETNRPQNVRARSGQLLRVR